MLLVLQYYLSKYLIFYPFKLIEKHIKIAQRNDHVTFQQLINHWVMLWSEQAYATLLHSRLFGITVQVSTTGFSGSHSDR